MPVPMVPGLVIDEPVVAEFLSIWLVVVPLFMLLAELLVGLVAAPPWPELGCAAAKVVDSARANVVAMMAFFMEVPH